MRRLSRQALILIVFFLLVTGPAFAAVGTPGPDGKIPYLTVDYKYVGGPVTVQLHNYSPSFSRVMFLMALKEERQDFTALLGPGGVLVPYQDKQKPLQYISQDPFMTLIPPVSGKAHEAIIQAIVEYKKPAPNGFPLGLSRPYKLKLTDKHQMSKMPPSIESIVPNAGEPQDIKIADGNIYTAVSGYGIGRFKLNSNNNPSYLDIMDDSIVKYSLLTHPKHIAIGEGRALTSADTYAISVASISANQAPKLMGELMIYPRKLYESEIFRIGQGIYAFINGKADGVVIVDVTSAAALKEVSSFLSSEHIDFIKKHKSSLLYTFSSSNKLRVYNANSVQNPSLLKTVSLPNRVMSAAFYGSYAFFLSKSGNEVYVYNTDANGVVTSLKNVVSLGTVSKFYSIVVDSQKAYLNSYAGLSSFSINWSSLDFTPHSSVSAEGIRNIALGSGVIHAVRSGGERGLYTYKTGNLQQLASPNYNLAFPKVRDLALVDTKIAGKNYRFAVVAEFKEGLRIFDVTDAANPKLVNSLSGDYRSVTAKENMLVLGDFQTHQIYVFSFLNEQGDLNIENVISMPDQIKDIAFDDNYMYVANHFSGLSIHKLSDPALPVAKLQLEDYAKAINLSGYFAYVSVGSGISVVDISEPEKPEQIQYLKGYTMHSGRGAADNRLLFLGNLSNGVQIFDITAPYSSAGITHIETFHSLNWPSDAAIGKNLAVASIAFSGNHASEKDLMLFDISEPSAFEKLTSLSIPQLRFSHGIEIRDDYIYITDTECGLAILDINK